ncbi:MAG: hypothetical protein ACKOJF_05635, partial [Planctomycetaceae bacterium]
MNRPAPGTRPSLGDLYKPAPESGSAGFGGGIGRPSGLPGGVRPGNVAQPTPAPGQPVTPSQPVAPTPPGGIPQPGRPGLGQGQGQGPGLGGQRPLNPGGANLGQPGQPGLPTTRPVGPGTPVTPVAPVTPVTPTVPVNPGPGVPSTRPVPGEPGERPNRPGLGRPEGGRPEMGRPGLNGNAGLNPNVGGERPLNRPVPEPVNETRPGNRPTLGQINRPNLPPTTPTTRPAIDQRPLQPGVQVGGQTIGGNGANQRPDRPLRPGLNTRPRP